MDARKPNNRLVRLVLLALLTLIALGLWQSYGAWALEQVYTRGS